MLIYVCIEAETYGDYSTVLGAVRDQLISFCASRGIDPSDELPNDFGMLHNDSDLHFNNCCGSYDIQRVQESEDDAPGQVGG